MGGDEGGRKARGGYSVLVCNWGETDTVWDVSLEGHGWRGWRDDVKIITATGKPVQKVIQEKYEQKEKDVQFVLPARSFRTIEIKFAIPNN